MSLGSWDPQAEAAAEAIRPDAATLARLVALSSDGRLEHLARILAPAERQRLAGLMRLQHSVWQSAAGALSDDELLHLIRFFAVAENLPGWEAGEYSPVIPLARILRGRGRRLDRDFQLWLRQVNDNRFLPYGPL